MVVEAEIVEEAWLPPPMTTALLVNDAADVTHVAHAIVPVAVIVPPVIGEVVPTLVTVPPPPPPALAQVELWQVQMSPEPMTICAGTP